MGEVLSALMDGKSPFDDGALTLSGRLMSWELKPVSARQNLAENNPAKDLKVAVYDGLPRVLDIPCNRGTWCFDVKRQHPDWIVEGVDTFAYWTQEYPRTPFK